MKWRTSVTAVSNLLFYLLDFEFCPLSRDSLGLTMYWEFADHNCKFTGNDATEVVGSQIVLGYCIVRG